METNTHETMRSLTSFDMSNQIEQLKNMSTSAIATFPPNLQQAYDNGYLTKEEYDRLQEVYKSANKSVDQGLANAQAAQQWFNDYDANMSAKQPPSASNSPTMLPPNAIHDGREPGPKGSNLASTIGIVLGAIATVAIIVGVILYAKRRRAEPKRGANVKKGLTEEIEDTAGSSTAYSSMISTSKAGASHLQLDDDNVPWRDETLLAVRVPLENVVRAELISRGGFGEVYAGEFKGRKVAIKTLLPEKRKDVKQIKAFWAEIKFMSTLEHPRIVEFIGVAWESLSDLCVVTEFMDGGDVRTLLQSFEESQPPRPHGFDEDKIKIALHVIHALTYLHSLETVVLHRDLKSRNILLDQNWNAKLTDFGVSRERIDETMTAGVGSSLWMAPEVMMGERYNEKADVFSFGVVLSELDTQQLPYADAREEGTGRPIPQTAVLQLVSLGLLTITLTESTSFPEIQQLARDCVAMNPSKRPNAAEALHRVHLAWKQTSGWNKAANLSM